MPHLEAVSLPFKQCLHEPNQLIEHIYFLSSGVASVLTVMKDGATVEVATIGNEGIVGISVLLGGDRYPTETIAQIPGDGLRMKVDVFKNQVPPGSLLHNLLKQG